jgi:hypothetical protein
MKDLAKTFFDICKGKKDIGFLASTLSYQIKPQSKNQLSFQDNLLSILQAQFKKLSKMDQLTDADDINNALYFVQMTGEFFKIRWIDLPKLTSCMDKLSANNFNSLHQLQMFKLLLEISSDEIIRS